MLSPAGCPQLGDIKDMPHLAAGTDDPILDKRRSFLLSCQWAQQQTALRLAAQLAEDVPVVLCAKGLTLNGAGDTGDGGNGAVVC